MLDRDLAILYGVENRVLKQAVRRNGDRSPNDFMSRLKKCEIQNVVSQNVIPDIRVLGGSIPMAFPEQGAAMLSTVLRSPQVIQVNIAIMRTFVQLRQLMDGNRELARKIHDIEEKYDEQFAVVFEAIKKLLEVDSERKHQSRRRAGFHP